MSNKIVKESYNKIADQYLKYRNDFKSEKYLEIFSKLVPKGRIILDVGCGAGIPVDEFLVKKDLL